mgnify:CR=1 FL=1
MKKSIIPLLAVLFFGCSNDFSDSSIDVLRPEKEDSVERVDICTATSKSFICSIISISPLAGHPPYSELAGIIHIAGHEPFPDENLALLL